MAEYIEREKAWRKVNRAKNIEEALNFIDSIPTADVVEVVKKPVKDYEGYYEVDQFGRVYSVDRVISVNDNGRQYEKPLLQLRRKEV
jgi:hypothetical protein